MRTLTTTATAIASNQCGIVAVGRGTIGIGLR
jgi:hypothetical protein